MKGNLRKRGVPGTNSKMAELLTLRRLAPGMLLASSIRTVLTRERGPLVMVGEIVTVP
jgi:hypothetical protein